MAESKKPGRSPKRPGRSPEGGGSTPGGSPRGGMVFWILLLLGLLAVAYTIDRSGRGSAREVSEGEFIEQLRPEGGGDPEYGKRGFVRYNEQEVVLLLKAEGKPDEPIISAMIPAASVDEWQARLEEWKREGLIRDYEYKGASPWLPIFLSNVLPLLLLLFLLWFLFLRPMRAGGGPGGVLAFGKSRATLASKEKTNVTFDDVAGIEEAKAEVQEVVEFLKNPAKFQRLGGRIPRGVLLVGPPGTGKTLLAKAIAGEADVPFFSISGSDFVEMFVGVGASRVRDLFRAAKEKAPCIIFLDEVDAVGRKRGQGFGGGHDEREQTLNAILVEMDGFTTDTEVIVIASTNRPDVLDSALLRPGRFDRTVRLDLPDLEARYKILGVHARRVKLEEGVDLKVLARGTPGFSGAELESIINEAAIIAVMRERPAVVLEDLEEARDKVHWGRKKSSRLKAMDAEDKRITAYHESGHAVVAKRIPECEPVHKVSIVPMGMALGATMQLPEKERFHMSRKQILAQLALLMGGRCAEEVFCDDITTGAQNDLERATELARRFVCEWGMSDELGPVHYSGAERHPYLDFDMSSSRKHSESTAQAIDREVRRLLDEAHARARGIVESEREGMDRMAEALLRYETLDAKDIDRVLKGVPLDDLDAAHRAVARTAPNVESVEEETAPEPDGIADAIPPHGGVDPSPA